MNKGLLSAHFIRKYGADNVNKCDDGTYVYIDEEHTLFYSDGHEIQVDDIFGKYFTFNGSSWICDRCKQPICDIEMRSTIEANMRECYKNAYSYDEVYKDFSELTLNAYAGQINTCAVCGEDNED